MPQFQFGNWKLGVGGGITLGVPQLGRVRVGINQNGDLTLNGSLSAFGLLTADLNANARQAAANSASASGGISAVSGSVDALSSSFSSFAGATSPDTIAAAVWSTPIDFGHSTAGDALGIIWRMAEVSRNSIVMRHGWAPHFLFWSMNSVDFPTESAVPDWTNVNPDARLSGETDRDMLLRLLPDYAWTDRYIGSSIVGASITLVPFGSFVAFYSPLEAQDLTLDAFKRLWDYTPASGPPVRNGIEDTMQIVALLPIQH